MKPIKEKEYLVVKSNELIQHASYNLTAEQQKFLCYIISKIKPSDKEFEYITVSASDFAELIGVDKRHIYTNFKNMANSFHDKANWIKIDETVMLFEIFLMPQYNTKQGSITVILNPHLRKYLLNLSRNYTQYELWNILSLKSKYSVRLYELFKSFAYKSENEFEIEHLKGLLCCSNYRNYNDFNKRVLTPATQEINELTNLNIEYTTRKRGKGGRVSEITFQISLKPSTEAYIAYWHTVQKINRKNKLPAGQTSIFDMHEEDFR